ncbi:MAG TPA: permease prefix domain 1-containing protein [Clostridia bacterium]|nr:permease prefix domain 1-containing protein [Clostridia bacterium]
MFDLEENIISWCDYLRSSGKLKEEDVLELKNHLREQIDDLKKQGLSDEEAFLISVKRLGNINTVSEEFSKINTENMWKQLLIEPADTSKKNKNRRDIWLAILFAILAGTFAKIPTLFGLSMDSIVYMKNLSFYILPFAALFFIIRHEVSQKKIWYLTGIFLLTGVIINLYPSYSPHHTEILTGIHLPLMLWMVTGVAYMGKHWRTSKERMNFIRFTGESVIYGSLIGLGLFVLMGFTALIFESISIDIEPFIENYFIIFGMPAAVMITVYLVETKKSIVENFAPILAKIFSPLFLISMVVFLIVMVINKKSPFVDRDFLISFDLMLILVLGMVLYIISARNIHDKINIFDYLNTALVFVAIIVDGVALSAIIFRLSEYGISPNKLAALGENLLLLINLAVLLWFYIKYFMNKIEFEQIEIWQTKYLTIYAVWVAVVVFVFPLIFGFI